MAEQPSGSRSVAESPAPSRDLQDAGSQCEEARDLLEIAHINDEIRRYSISMASASMFGQQALPRHWGDCLSSVRLPLGDEEVQEYAAAAADWASAHGFLSAIPGSAGVYGVRHLPVSLFPTPFPADQYFKAVNVQLAFNVLMHRVRCDADFLLTHLKAAAEIDEFTSKLLRIHRVVQSEGVAQSLSLSIHRSDYMLHEVPGCGPPVIKQVEVNTISAGFAAATTFAHGLHRYMFSRYALGPTSNEDLPINESLTTVVDGFVTAVNLYTEKYGVCGVVLFVVQPEERNIFDQRWVEYNLWEHHGIRVVRRTLTQIDQRAELRADRALIIDGHQVAVAYFRSGYGPKDYPTSAEWTARLTVERSRAIKCPTIADQLSGSKKVQQVLANRNVLRRFMPEEEVIHDIETTFVKLYSLDDDAECQAIVDHAIANPDQFVLKPQREGGGNNLYRAELKQALQTMTPKERGAYILMERIHVPWRRNYLVREGRPVLCDITSELGVYGVTISDGNTIVLSQVAGTLLRSKPVELDEGGVSAGFAVLDSPFLVRNSIVETF